MTFGLENGAPVVVQLSHGRQPVNYFENRRDGGDPCPA
jgi:hypothetical protein